MYTKSSVHKYNQKIRKKKKERKVDHEFEREKYMGGGDKKEISLKQKFRK